MLYIWFLKFILEQGKLKDDSTRFCIVEKYQFFYFLGDDRLRRDKRTREKTKMKEKYIKKVLTVYIWKEKMYSFKISSIIIINAFFFPYLMQIVKVKDETTMIGRKLNTTS